jgi:HlyD family secretion protein
MIRPVFRQQVLDRLTSPDQLDAVMKMTSARAWALLAALSLLVVSTVVWAVFGTIAVRLSGVGILIKSGGVLNVVALASGQLTALYVDVGHEVHRGQIVARIAQPDLAQQVDRAKAKLAELTAQHQALLKLGTTGEQVYSGYVAQERGALASSIEAARERLSDAVDAEKKKNQLYSQGLVTKQALVTAKEEVRAAREAITRASTQIRGLSVSTQEAKGQKEKEILNSELRLNEAKREIQLLEERLELTGRIVSPHSGRVIEIRAREGDVVDPAKPIVSLEPAGTEGSGLEALIYLPLSSGKTVLPGMRAQISPDGTRREEYGAMIGIVTSVSDFPSTEDGMRRILGNDLLVRKLLDSVGLAPIAVRAELVPDFRTRSNYRWTSRDGPPVTISPGTPCQATIEVRRMHPIQLIVPLIRRSAGLDGG